jgi:hypothetical protein
MGLVGKFVGRVLLDYKKLAKPVIKMDALIKYRRVGHVTFLTRQVKMSP